MVRVPEVHQTEEMLRDKQVVQELMEEMEEIGPKNLKPPAISPMVRERREASARAELEGR